MNDCMIPSKRAGFLFTVALLYMLSGLLPGIGGVAAAKAKKAPDPQAAIEAKLANEAMTNNDLGRALDHFIKAHQLDPTAQNYLHSAAVLSKNLQKNEQALRFFLKAVPLAGKAKNREDIAFYNKEIAALRSVNPPWVNEQMAQAAPVPPKKRRAAGMWSRMQQGAGQAVAKGDIEGAIKLSKRALQTAEDNFGDDHYVVMVSLRELAVLQFQAGKGEEALAGLDKAAALGERILSPNHPEVLTVLSLKADLLDALSQRNKARDVRQVAYDRFRGEGGLGPNHLKSMQAGIALGRSFLNLSQEDKAQPLLTGLCHHVKKTLGVYAKDLAECLSLMATVQERKGNLEIGVITFKRIEKIQTLALEKNAPALLSTKVERAEVVRRLGHYDEAQKIIEEVLASGLDAEDRVMVDAKERLVRVLEDLGEFDRAEKLTREVLAYEEKNLPEGHPNILSAQDKLAGILRHKGQLTEAEALYKSALEGFRKVLGDENQATLNVMNNLGLTLENAGLYDEAEPLLRLTVGFSRKKLGDNHPTTLAFMNNLALLYESQGVFDKAEPLYKQGIESASDSLGEEHPDVIAFINNLAYLALLQQDYEKASPLFEKVLDVWQKSLGEGHQKTLKGMNNLARVRHHQGKFEEAEKLFVKALDLRKKALGDKHMDVLRSMHDLGALYREMKRYDEAEKLLRETLKLDDEVLGEQHPYTFETVNTLAGLLEDKEDMAGAYAVRKMGFERRTEFLNRMLWATGDNAREGYVRLHRPELVDYLALLSRMDDSADGGKQVLEVGLQRKGLMLKITSEIRQIAKLAQDPELDALGQELTRTRKKLAALTLSGPTDETKRNHLETLHDLENQVDMLQLRLGDASKRFRRSVSKLTADDLLRYLPEEAALVDYLVFKDGKQSRLLAAVVTLEEGEPQYSLVNFDASMKKIHTAIREYRTIIQDEDADEDELLEVGMMVYDMVWSPLKEALDGRTKVYLVPDGMLNILPFNALVDDEGAYLAKSLDLHILTSSRDLIPFETPKAAGGLIIMAGPDYDTDSVGDRAAITQIQGKRAASVSQGMRSFSGMRGLKFDPLPGAEKEGRIIMDQVGNLENKNKIYIKLDAQEEVVQSISEPPEVLHIATHGFFLKPDDSLRKRLLKLSRGSSLQMPPPGDNPLLRSGLAFAGINGNAQFLGEIDTNNDGVLTALEVLALDLAGTQLTVLSACETGLGEIHEGEGVYGLRRAFQEAGSEAVIASLWEVSDAGTQALMVGLYRRLNEGMSPHQALREARHEMMNSGEWNYPYIWSAFMLVGK
ncbi:MAG: tetratricopeptide repeat protein [Magnetococcales bacterium]|nr:tetratricopeptide repeat protein [Magnetococcales bacterium]